jgi:hypothetical protein
VISVMRTKFIKSWPSPGERAYHLSTEDAFTRQYASDAHFCQYTSPHRRRLCRAALKAGAVATINVIALDLDCPTVHGTKAPAPDAWRDEVTVQVGELAKTHPGPFLYHTRGGARLVYRQPAPVTIATDRDEAQWSLDYVITAAYLARAFGLIADAACIDWTRLFRLPRACRDGKVEDYPMYGDPSQIQPLVFIPDPADHTHVEATHKPRKAHVAAQGPAYIGDGCGVFYHALRARGDVLRGHALGHVIRCPRERHHSSGVTGDGSTLLWAPSGTQTMGAIHCLHSHCTGMTAKEWHREFTRDEMYAADVAAGTRGTR